MMNSDSRRLLSDYRREFFTNIVRIYAYLRKL